MPAFDAAEQKYLEELNRVSELNQKRIAAGLQPVSAGQAPESYVETMAYRMEYAERDIPWHVNAERDVLGAKVAVDHAMTSEEAIKAAQLDWTVALGPLWGGAQRRLVEGKVAIYRETDGRVLGICSPRYQIIQNRDVFAFLDSLVADNILTYETAGSIYGGKMVWLLARMGDDWTVRTPAGEDAHNAFLCATTSHDGSGRLKAFLTEVRVVCRNTTMLALAGAEWSVAVSHKGDIEDNMEKARKLLEVSTAAQRKYQEWVQSLVEVEVDQEAVDAVQTAMFGSLDEDTSIRRQNQIQKFLEIYHSEAEQQGNTGFALLNACTGYATHASALRIREDGSESMVSLLQGPNQEYSRKGFAAIEKATGLELSLV